MAITYFGSASNPLDNNLLNGPDVAVTPPASMVAGDLVLLIPQIKSGTVSPINVTVTGGQTWNTAVGLITDGSTILSIFWCEFNGTWDADPNVNWGGTPGTDPMTVVMHVFRPGTAALTWFLDGNTSSGTFPTPGSGQPVILAGTSPPHDSTVTMALWATPDDNNWGDPTGGSWAGLGTQEYRNTSGTGMCITFARVIQTASGPTGDVESTQGGLNRDAGLYIMRTWYEANTEINLRGGTLLGGTIGA